MKTLSIIVTTHNNAAEIERTLASAETAVAVLRRNGPGEDRAVEVVVVDDGSSDGTRLVVEALTRGKDIDSKVISRDRSSSPSCARNTGVAASSGELLFFLDGDDAFLPDHLHQCVGAFEEDASIDFVKTGVALSHPVHPTWHGRIRNSLVLNLAVKRRCHEFVGGFPDLHLFRRQGDHFSHDCDIFRMFEDVYYNTLIAALFKGRSLPVATVTYFRWPGNSFDRRYSKYQSFPGQNDDGFDDDELFRIKLGHLLINHQIALLRKSRPEAGGHRAK